MWAPLAMSTTAAGRIGLRRRIAGRPARVRVPAEEHEAGKPHHARSVSMSRSTCIASARSASSAASSSASARTAAAAFRRAVSMSAARTAADTGVPSLVKTASARDASSSGRKVIVSATESSVIQNVRRRRRPPRVDQQAAVSRLACSRAQPSPPYGRVPKERGQDRERIEIGDAFDRPAIVQHQPVHVGPLDDSAPNRGVQPELDEQEVVVSAPSVDATA